MEQARAVADAMLALWESELPGTVRVLAAVTDAGRDYRPDARGRSAWELATHIATADLWFLDGIVKGRYEFDPEAAQQAQSQFRTVAEVVAFHERMVPAALARVRGLSDDELAQNLDFFGMMAMPRAQWIGFANNHSVHHRGQLSAYLRSLGSKVPDIYGPSADAERAPVAG
jgi:uncharacterized damage-inducible protein DinB